MGLFTDLEFIGKISHQLERFRWVNPSKTANFRCIICGDSKKNSRKARGYLFWHKDTFFYKGHCCGASMSLFGLLQQKFPQLLDEYRLAKFREDRLDGAPMAKRTFEQWVENVPPVVPKSSPTIADLPHDHEAVKYVAGRKIPESRWDDIGYTENFSKWVSDASGNAKYKRLPKDKRILFELRDESGNLFGVQGRSLGTSSAMRYITIRFTDDQPKLFGLDQLNTTLPITVVEGPIDSLFIPNSIAICGGDVSLSLNRFRGKDLTVALDNEPRSADTVSRMQAAIEKGFHVCFWRLDTKFKDINDMVLKGGMTPEMVVQHIQKNSYSGGYAQATLLNWKKT